MLASIASPETAIAGAASPLAPEARVEILARLDVPALRRKWRERLGIELDDSFPSKGEIVLYRCTASDLRFFHPRELEGGPSLYERLQKLDWYYSHDRWDFRHAIEDLADCRRVLEVGCGTGEFLAMIARHHPAIRATGVELNDAASAKAASQGFDVERAPLDQLAARFGGQFDAVCAFQVLEHVADIRGFLTSCIALLRPGGKLLVSVPNARGYLEYDDEILDSPPHHMSRWSSDTFRFLASRFPLELESIRHQSLTRREIGAYSRSKQIAWSQTSAIASRRVCSELARRATSAILRVGFYRICRGHSLYAVLRSNRATAAR